MIWGDTAIFINPTDPDNCLLTNRFKRGQRVGFRMTAIDGGTGEVEQHGRARRARHLCRKDGRCADAMAR